MACCLRSLFWIPALAFVLTACGSSRTASAERPAATASKPAIEEQSKPLREPESPYRTVVSGDTLYSIAWESGRDYRELAIWNRLVPPYTIKPGQQLRVVPPENTAAEPVSTSTAAKKPGTTTASKPTASRPVAKPAAPGGTAPAKPATTRPEQKKIANKTPASPPPRTGDWVWPADGPVLNLYSETARKGLDIAGTKGAPVRAAAAGRVVYQGSGLRGYGQLIIIKHSDEFLSAYAHNDRIHVKEGDVVKRGQKIADMGSTGTDRVKLHFEIRRQGTPIDPLKYLPKR